MNEEILHRAMQVAFYSGGIISFWQISKHMPKAFYTTLECISVMACTVLIATPIAGIIEYILGGTIEFTITFAGIVASVGFLCVIWMFIAQLSREWCGKKQFEHLIF